MPISCCIMLDRFDSFRSMIHACHPEVRGKNTDGTNILYGIMLYQRKEYLDCLFDLCKKNILLQLWNDLDESYRELLIIQRRMMFDNFLRIFSQEERLEIIAAFDSEYLSFAEERYKDLGASS